MANLTVKNRWITELGQATRRRLMELLDGTQRTGPDPSAPAILEILKELPLVEQVAPAIDFRGLEFTELLCISNVDWPKARFDSAAVNGNLTGNLSGAVFDRARADKVLLQGDFSGASFVRASLKGTRFYGSTLEGADFTEARMQGCSLEKARCQGAKFVGANLRMAHCPHADMRNADLRNADLTGAVLGGVSFDQNTLIENTILVGASMDSPLRTFAGVDDSVSGTAVYELSCFDATVRLLTERGDARNAEAIRLMQSCRDKIKNDPSYDWTALIKRKLSKEVLDDILEAYEEASSNLEEYLE